ncbi:MAG: FG-GAP-like repeat-containing protein [Armatimonadota bacterium]
MPPSRSLLLLALFCVAAAASAAAPRRTRVTPPFPWARDLGAGPRIPIVADVDGDGFDDLLSLWPRGRGWLDLARNAGGEKSLPPRRVLGDFGGGCVAATALDLDGDRRAEVLALSADGTLHLAEGLDGAQTRSRVLTAVPGKWSDVRWLSAAAGRKSVRFTLLAHTGEGALVTLPRSEEPAEPLVRRFNLGAAPSAAVLRWSGRDPDAGAGRAEVVWTDAEQRVRESAFSADTGKRRADRTRSKDDGLALSRALLGLPAAPGRAADRAAELSELRWERPSTLLSGDLNGDGRPDLVRFRRDDERHAGGDVLVYLAYRDGDPDPDSDGLDAAAEQSAGSDPVRRDTDNDGLLDGWEVNGWRGFDLAALGCTPDHADILVRIQRAADLDEERTRTDMEAAVRYYAGLPVPNPDGKSGIRLHYVLEPALPAEQVNGRDWRAVGDAHFPARMRGAWHWMLAPNAGGGQADMLSDRGSAGGRALYATFIHEFGHQLGLPHEGFWPGGWCPAYPSLMNYAYSYQLGGKAEAIGYSLGKLAHLVFDERKLSERLPLKYEEAAFLAGPPYHWRLKADGDTNLIDWNWNGIFGEENVRADINYGYSTTAGVRRILMPGRDFDAQDRTGHAPFLASHADRLYAFYVRAPRDAKADELMTPEERQAAAPIPGPVTARVLGGNGRWSEPVTVSEDVATGDPYAVAHAGDLWLFYPTAEGLRARQVGPDGRATGDAYLLDETAGASVSAVSWGERLLLFLWRGADRELTCREWSTSGAGPERGLGIRSTVPVGPCVDPLRNTLVLACGEDQDARRKSRWLLRTFTALPDGALAEAGRRWVMGEAGRAGGTRRPTLLFESGPLAGPEGRLHLIAVGTVNEANRKSCYFSYMTVADRTINDGWLQRRYYDEWTESASAVGACWYRDDIALASRWYGVANREFRDNGVYVALQGLGIQDEPMGDHNDVEFIAQRGMAHSILYLQVAEPVTAPRHRRGD